MPETVTRSIRRSSQRTGGQQHSMSGQTHVLQMVSAIRRETAEFSAKGQGLLPDVEERNKERRGQHRDVSGNSSGRAIKVFFPYADTDVPVRHNLGKPTNRYVIKDTDAPARIYRVRDGGPQKMWLRSDTAEVTAVVMVVPGGH